ncbi:MAG: hypothetical protein M8872_05210 [marine benthic group bacterium]|nr:hypothetical protein [Gemmatimonadota bacterium]
MRKLGVSLCSILLLGLVGCGDSPVATDADSATELLKKPPPVEEPEEWPIAVTFADRDGDQVRSDAELRPDLSDHAYVDGECGVWGNIGNFDDARMDPDRDWKRKLARTCGTERVIVFEFDEPREPARAEVGAFLSVEDICTMAVGDTPRTGVPAQFNVCNVLSFDAGVQVQRTDASTWIVSTDGTDAAATCLGDGSTHTMPFELTITMLEAGC